MSEQEIRRGYYEDGSIEWESYVVNGQLHRSDGPAVIFYYEDGSIHREEYWVNGQVHRSDGPAVIQYYQDGSIYREEYWVRGRNITGGVNEAIEDGQLAKWPDWTRNDFILFKLKWC